MGRWFLANPLLGCWTGKINKGGNVIGVEVRISEKDIIFTIIRNPSEIFPFSRLVEQKKANVTI